MEKTLRILVVEDSEDDALLVLQQIKKGDYIIASERVETAERMKTMLNERTWDIILSDYVMPHFQGLEALELLKESGIDIPFIIISGTIGEDVAVEAMKAGANDYIMKDNLQRLLPAIERELRESGNRAEQKRAELQLIESEQKFRSLAESSPDNIIRYDTKCRAVYINRNMNLTVGSDAVPFIGHAPMESSNYTGAEEYQAKLEQVIQTGQPDELEVVVPDLKGEFRVHHIRFVAERNNDFKIIGALAIGRDINDRKQAEMEITLVNRSLLMLSNVNKALILITDETTLLNEVCRITVEIGGYCLVWVGFAEHDEAKTVNPVAQAGFDSGYIESLNLTWADTDRGRGPSGIAIRTGQPYIVRNIQSESSFAIWREAAIQHGYKSFIALPLICENQTLGVMAIYSAETDTFNNKEVEILKELTDDLAFGITALRTRAKKRQAEEALRESEERYRLIAENTADTIAVLDLNLNFTYISPSVRKLRGFSIEEASKQSLDQVFTPASLQKANKSFTEHMALEANGKADPYRTETLELEENCKDGSTIWVEISISFLRDANLKPTGILTVARDITERKRAEEDLRILSRAVEQSPASIIITDTEGKIKYVNSKFTELTGYTPNEVLGQNPRILKSDEMAADYYKEMWLALISGKEWFGEFHNKKKNGELYWELVSISPIFDTTGIITHFLAVKEDITNRKQTEQELINAKEKAEESERLKTAFLANMSHEIRTPMNGILGFAGLLKEPNLTGDEQQEYIKIIEKSGARMLNIINNIVDISKIEAGLMNVHIKESNVNEQIEDIYTFFKPEVESKGMKLYYKNGLPLKEANIRTDNEKVYSILTNLVKNAIKYTYEGSIEFGYKLVETIHELPLLEFYVKDTGIGIPKERQKAVFERFIQADIADKMARQGAGLGLTIAKSYIEMLGGKIRIDSEEGIGSTFYFTLPYNIKQEEKKVIGKVVPAEDEENQINPEVSELKILIAEDDETSEKLISVAVSMFSKEVLEARTGNEAVEICRANPDLDLILMDIQLPDLNGHEATRQIRQFNKDVVIIAQTAFGLFGDREKAIEAGCNDYIAKPINKDELLELIQKYFKKYP